METVLNKFVECLNNSIQSYITYLYVHEIIQVLVLLIFLTPLIVLAYKTMNKIFTDLK